MGSSNYDDIPVTNPVIVPAQPNPEPESIKPTPASEIATPTTN